MKARYILTSISISLLLFSCAEKKPAVTKTDTVNHVQYQLAAVKRAGLSQTIKLPAQLAAYQEISIYPKLNGYVQTVSVDIGSHVSKGQLLMLLDAPEIKQQVIQAKEKYARSLSDYNIARDNYLRLKVAAATEGAISPMDLATAKAKMESDSSLSNAEKANWQMEQTLLDYLQVTAPFSGVITERNTHPGALVSATNKDKPLLELKQINKLRLQADIPEGIATGLKEHDPVNFALSAFPGKKMSATINRKANNINIQYRSERIEMDVDNADGSLSPGMYAEILLENKGNAAAHVVPRSAVITSTERRYVIAVRAGKTMKIDVATGNETPAQIEVTGNLQDSDQVIVNASDEIPEGETVK